MADRQAPEAPARSARRQTRRRLASVSAAARTHLGVTVALGVLATALIVAQATLLARVVADASPSTARRSPT